MAERPELEVCECGHFRFFHYEGTEAAVGCDGRKKPTDGSRHPIPCECEQFKERDDG